MAKRYPIGTGYEDWVRELDAKGWNKMTRAEMAQYRTLSTMQSEVKRLEEALRQKRLSEKNAVPKLRCQIKWCKAETEETFCPRCKENIASWETKSQTVTDAPTKTSSSMLAPDGVPS